jgi:glutamyl-tRNA synthetase
MSNKVRTRFAPSPTGYMHIGNLRTALYAYLFAKANDGDFILRIEDTDRNRYVPDAVDFINRTLAAAHIVPDEGPEIGGAFGPYVQSQRQEIYQKYADALIENGFAYRCFCSPDEGHTAASFSGYDRTCRDLSPAVIQQHLDAGDSFVIRQKMPLNGATTFHDMVHGNITIQNDELEDQVLIKRDGMPTYNFANVIDDHLMQVTHIIRGVEFITSTPKHVLLYQSFGWDPPAFVHLPPVMGKNEDGSVSKLSKRHGATSFAELVAMGYLPEAITNYVALLGWSPKSNQELFSMDEMAKVFALDGLSKSSAVFDYAKLNWFNSEYFKQMSDADFAQAALPFAGELTDELQVKWPYLAALLKPRINRYGEIADQIAFFRTLPEYSSELFSNKRNKVTPEVSAAILPAVCAALEPLADWTPDTINTALHGYIDGCGLKMGTVMWPLRIALSGQKVTPGGVTELLYLLGKEICLKRLQKGIAILANI